MTRAGEYKTEYFLGTVTYRLGGDGQWEANDSDVKITLEKEEWDVLGEWSYSDERNPAVRGKPGFPFDSASMKSARRKYYYEEKGKYVFQSDGVLDLEIGSRHNNDVFISETIDQIDGTGQYELTTDIALMLGRYRGL